MKLQKNESKKAPVEIVSHHCELFNGAFSIYNPFGLNSRLVSWMGCPRKFKPRQKLLSSWIRFFSFVSFHLYNKRYLSTSVLNWMICSPHGFTNIEYFYKWFWCWLLVCLFVKTILLEIRIIGLVNSETMMWASLKKIQFTIWRKKWCLYL